MFLALYFKDSRFQTAVSGLFHDAYHESLCVGWSWSDDLLKEGFNIPIVEHLLSADFFSFIKYSFMALFGVMSSESSNFKFYFNGRLLIVVSLVFMFKI